MTHYRKGANFERTLVKKFWEHGFAAMRAAGSGSAPLPLPDIVAIKDGRVIVVECKTSARESFYLGKKDVTNLEEFCRVSGAEPYIAVKFDKLVPKFIPLGAMSSKKLSKKDPFISFETLVGEQSML